MGDKHARTSPQLIRNVCRNCSAFARVTTASYILWSLGGSQWKKKRPKQNICRCWSIRLIGVESHSSFSESAGGHLTDHLLHDAREITIWVVRGWLPSGRKLMRFHLRALHSSFKYPADPHHRRTPLIFTNPHLRPHQPCSRGQPLPKSRSQTRAANIGNVGVQTLLL
jgi:hypothetical protein